MAYAHTELLQSNAVTTHKVPEANSGCAGSRSKLPKKKDDTLSSHAARLKTLKYETDNSGYTKHTARPLSSLLAIEAV